MRKTIYMCLIVSISFISGFGFKTFLSNQQQTSSQKKVTGIGGIFFKSKNPKLLKEWYQKHLGINTNQYGAVFEWRQGADSSQKGFTQWSLFKESTNYFEPSTQNFMINYRVENLETLTQQLKTNGVTVLDSIQSYSYGKFLHILDIENNKIELWEANDVEYEKLGKQLGSKTTK